MPRFVGRGQETRCAIGKFRTLNCGSNRDAKAESSLAPRLLIRRVAPHGRRRSGHRYRRAGRVRRSRMITVSSEGALLQYRKARELDTARRLVRRLYAAGDRRPSSQSQPTKVICSSHWSIAGRLRSVERTWRLTTSTSASGPMPPSTVGCKVPFADIGDGDGPRRRSSRASWIWDAGEGRCQLAPPAALRLRPRGVHL